MASSGLDVDSVIERLLSVRGQPNNRTVQLAEGEIRALCATARCVVGALGHATGGSAGFFFLFLANANGAPTLPSEQNLGSSAFAAQTRVPSPRR